MEQMLNKLPRLSRNDENFFRSLGNQGVISYRCARRCTDDVSGVYFPVTFSEYLFLLTILIKPQSGFKIAFAMLDQDGNERIDKKEFEVTKLSQVMTA